MTDFCIAGADPGSHGAVAFIWPDLGKLMVTDLPTFKLSGSSRTFTYCDGVGLADLLEKHTPVHTYLERVHSMPTDGAVGAFTFGNNFGTIIGVHAGLRIPLSQVTPSVWKSNLKVPADKKESTARAKALFPACSKLFTRGDKAEAAMIALYGLLHLGHVLKKRLEPWE